ncbi:MAG: rhodanese-like domain-containing protein [Burkholderiales bacterium]
MKLIDRNALQQRLDRVTLVEALPEKYYRDGHLPGARHLPHDQVRSLAPSLLPDRGAGIVVYCASATCQNSHIAARVLEQLGYGDVAVYAGGKQDWSEAGLPLEPGETVPARTG